jgi:hypothetical protein
MANEMSTVAKKAKSFWDTKEGTTGMVIGLGIFGAIGYGAYKIMPFLANLMENTFYTILFGGLSVALFYILVIDGTLRNRAWLAYRLMMRALTYSIISYDPVGVLREISKKAWERFQHIDECRIKVNGQVKQLEETIRGFYKDQKSLTTEATTWQSRGDMDKARSAASKLGRLNEAIARLESAAKRTQGFYTQLTRAQKAAEQIRENVDFEIGLVEREYKATTAAHTAWKMVREAFKGGSELDALEQDALAFLAEDYGNKLGEIDSFMEDSMKYIDNVDMQNAGFAEDGFKMLDTLNARQLNIVEAKVSLPAPQQQFIIPTVVGSASKIDYAKVTVKK